MQAGTLPDLEFSPRHRRTWLISRMGWLFLVVACWSYGTPSAWATCGDYVTIESPHSRHSEVTLEGESRLFDVDFNVATQSHSRPAKPPCHGPECRQQRLPSPAIPVPVPVSYRNELGVLLEIPSVVLLVAARWQNRERDVAPPHNPATRIERPPR